MLKSIVNLPQTSIDYLRKVLIELRNMQWLGLSEVARNTAIVIALLIFFVLMITSMDSVFVAIRTNLFTLI